MMKKQLSGVLMAAAAASGFGLVGIFAKVAYGEGISVSSLLASRFLIAAGLFWLWIGFTRPAFSLRRQDKWLLPAMGVGGYAVMAVLLFYSFYYISAALAEMLFYTYPALVCLGMRIVYKEPLTQKKSCCPNYRLCRYFHGTWRLARGCCRHMGDLP